MAKQSVTIRIPPNASFDEADFIGKDFLLKRKQGHSLNGVKCTLLIWTTQEEEARVFYPSGNEAWSFDVASSPQAADSTTTLNIDNIPNNRFANSNTNGLNLRKGDTLYSNKQVVRVL